MVTVYELQYFDRGPIGREKPGRVVELMATYPDGRRLQVATYHAYQKRHEAAHLVLYPNRIHRASFLPKGDEGKKVLSISEIRR